MNLDPNQARAKFDFDFEDGFAYSDSADNNSSDSTEQQAPSPRLRQGGAEQEDLMQIDGASDDEGSKRGGNAHIKRQWSEIKEDAENDEPLESSEPRRKRQRTEEKWFPLDADTSPGSSSTISAPVQQACHAFHIFNDKDFIDLIRKHGGQLVDAKGKEVFLTSAIDGSFEFKSTITCLMLERLRDNLPFPGREEFIPNAFGLFIECLEEAGIANNTEIVRRLLATKMGDTATEMLYALQIKANAAGAIDSAALLGQAYARASISRPMTRVAAPPPSLGINSVLPAAGWQQYVDCECTDKEINAILDCFSAGGDVERGLSLLFGAQRSRPAGNFFIRPLNYIGPKTISLLKACGGVCIENSEDSLDAVGCLLLYSNDFNTEKLWEGLLEGPANDVFEENGTELTRLMIDVQWGDAELVSVMLEEIATTNSTTNNGMSALLFAAWAGATQILELLLPFHPDLNAVDTIAYSALALAAKRGHLDACALLLSNGAMIDVNEHEDDASDDDEKVNKVAPLSAAAENGQADACAFLVGRGANINLQDHNGNSPLMLAAMNGFLETCQTLVVLGAATDLISKQGYSLLCCAASGGNIVLFHYLHGIGATLEKLERSNKEMTPLIAAARANHLPMLQLLLEMGISVNQTNLRLKTALIQASKKSWPEVVEFLLQKGAKPDLTDLNNRNALLYAAENGNLQILNLLIKYGSALKSKQNFGFRALGLAVTKDYEDIVASLLAYQIDTDPLALTGLYLTGPRENPLLKLDFDFKNKPHERMRILELLLQHGTPVHHADYLGQDALMLATVARNTDAVKMLLSYGARIGQVDTFGENALQTAIKYLNTSLLERLDASFTSRFLTMLLAALHKQDNAFILRKELLQQDMHPVTRDILMHSVTWSQFENGEIPHVTLGHSLIGLLTDFLKTISIGLPDMQDDEKITRMMALAGLTQPIIDLLLPYALALPMLRPHLLGTLDNDDRTTLESFVSGIFMALEPTANLAAAGNWHPYDQYQLSPQTLHILESVTNALMFELIRIHSKHEEDVQAEAFSNLFETCLAQTWNVTSTPSALSAQLLDPSAISYALRKQGIYAALAADIAAAWIESWASAGELIVVVEAAQRHADVLSISNNPATVPNSELIIDVDYLAQPKQDDDTFFAQLLNQTPPQAQAQAQPQALQPAEPPFTESPQAAIVLTTFRHTLKRRLDTPGTDILTLPGATPEVAQIYTNLMFRQLHMLAQFIHG